MLGAMKVTEVDLERAGHGLEHEYRGVTAMEVTVDGVSRAGHRFQAQAMDRLHTVLVRITREAVVQSGTPAPHNMGELASSLVLAPYLIRLWIQVDPDVPSDWDAARFSGPLRDMLLQRNTDHPKATMAEIVIRGPWPCTDAPNVRQILDRGFLERTGGVVSELPLVPGASHPLLPSSKQKKPYYIPLLPSKHPFSLVYRGEHGPDDRPGVVCPGAVG